MSTECVLLPCPGELLVWSDSLSNLFYLSQETLPGHSKELHPHSPQDIYSWHTHTLSVANSKQEGQKPLLSSGGRAQSVYKKMLLSGSHSWKPSTIPWPAAEQALCFSMSPQQYISARSEHRAHHSWHHGSTQGWSAHCARLLCKVSNAWSLTVFGMQELIQPKTLQRYNGEKCAWERTKQEKGSVCPTSWLSNI